MLASGMLGDWFLPYLYNIGIPGFRSSVFAWIFLGGLLALARIFDKQDTENPSTELGSHIINSCTQRDGRQYFISIIIN